MIDAKAWFISDLPISLIAYYIVFIVSTM